jgi:hypothetical protein
MGVSALSSLQIPNCLHRLFPLDPLQLPLRRVDFAGTGGRTLQSRIGRSPSRPARTPTRSPLSVGGLFPQPINRSRWTRFLALLAKP